MTVRRLACVFLLPAFVIAQEQQPPAADQPAPAQQPAANAPASATADQTELLAEVIEVHGDVRSAPLDGGEWTPVKLGDKLAPRTRVLTGVRSSVKLRIGEEEPYTALLVDQVGLTLLAEAFKTAGEKNVRVGVSYGRVRGGVAEGGLRSSFTVDSPVATLSKRGTWGFELSYERATDFFQIGLAQRGLVIARDLRTGESRTVAPREHIDSAMRRWLDDAEIHRNVSIGDVLGQESIEIAFNRIDNEGFGALSPGAGSTGLVNLSNAQARAVFGSLAQQSLSRQTLPPQARPGGGRNREPLLRPEGFFGTGRGDDLVEILIDAGNPLAERGWARPGRYTFRRSAIESWLAKRSPR